MTCQNQTTLYHAANAIINPRTDIHSTNIFTSDMRNMGESVNSGHALIANPVLWERMQDLKLSIPLKYI